MGRRHRGMPPSHSRAGGAGHVHHLETSGVAHLVLEAAAALSNVTAPDELLMRFLRLCLEATAAECGALLLEEDGEAFVRAFAAAEHDVSLQHSPLSSRPDIA